MDSAPRSRPQSAVKDVIRCAVESDGTCLSYAHEDLRGWNLKTRRNADWFVLLPAYTGVAFMEKYVRSSLSKWPIN